MNDLLKNIVNILATIVEFLKSTILGIFNLISNISNWVTYSIGLINSLIPTQILVFILLAITISVILFLIDRK